MTDYAPWWLDTPESRHMLTQELAAMAALEAEHEFDCHCGSPVIFGYDGNPEHHRGMCAHCDPIRCDAYPGECGR